MGTPWNCAVHNLSHQIRLPREGPEEPAFKSLLPGIIPDPPGGLLQNLKTKAVARKLAPEARRSGDSRYAGSQELGLGEQHAPQGKPVFLLQQTCRTHRRCRRALPGRTFHCDGDVPRLRGAMWRPLATCDRGAPGMWLG